MQADKMVLGRDEMDRLIMMRLDVDRYENETIPDLQLQAMFLREALQAYGCHKASCAIKLKSETECTCGLAAALGDTRTLRA
ncbi:MAG: hypothetical protein M3075_09670 [Candidatus Dormibacteraeota bacterium]|jgi:hypothetical protein|nr:hypothetical protein [Candidatus Dormibacteraeota bacterium]